jgi:hypothetical protein
MALGFTNAATSFCPIGPYSPVTYRSCSGVNKVYKDILVALGGLVVSVLDPRFAGSIPTEVDGFLRVIKIRSTTSTNKAVGPMS